MASCDATGPMGRVWVWVVTDSVTGLPLSSKSGLPSLSVFGLSKVSFSIVVASR